MKKLFVILGFVAALSLVYSCKEKRCECTYLRTEVGESRGLEPKGNLSSCSELDKIWEANDSTGQLIKKTCVDYIE